MEIIRDYLVAVNIITLFIYGYDKFQAQNDRWRVPEKTLLGFAIIGGSVGAWIGMKIFHHKTRKVKFSVGVPVIFALQCILIWMSYNFI